VKRMMFPTMGQIRSKFSNFFPQKVSHVIM
jgi:hypothetical protein